jgi:uroporphyrinogen-III synthase
MASKPAVLVTRPEGQAADLCAAVSAAGYEVHSQPLLQLRAPPELAPPQRERVVNLDRYQHIIFISGNAVRFGMALIEGHWPRLPAGPIWYAIGSATSSLLQQHGVTALTPRDGMTSEALLALPQLGDVAGQRVLLIKGEGGRETLREELGRRGARVDELACYRRSCPALAPGELAAKLSRWNIGLIMISSGEGLANLLSLLSPQETSKFRSITFLVPSERVAQMAGTAGFFRVVTAENASDGAMLRALEAWQSSAGE